MAWRDLFRRADPAPAIRLEPTLALPGIGHNGGPELARSAPAASPRRGGRGWLAAQPSRLLADLPGGAAIAPNREIRTALPVLRARSRWLAQNDGFAAGFLHNLRRNVIGPAGLTLQMKVKADRGDGLDTDANARLEEHFAEWSRVGACEVTGQLSRADLERLLILATARDGEALVRKVRGARWGRHGFALQVLDPILLEETLNVPRGTAFGGYRLAADAEIRMGVERDGYERPTAYWLRTTMPGDDYLPRGANRSYVRVPASEILHLFIVEWPGQVRGIPWLASAIRSLAMLDGYTEAELTAARVAASKMGFYEMEAGAEAEEIDGELLEDAKIVQQAEAGSFELLPRGVKLKAFDPQHPPVGFAAFCSAILRHASGGAGLSYAAFANDPASLSYSALRATELEDRDEYRTLQDWMIGRFNVPVFGDWLREALISGVTGLPPGKFWKFNAPSFRGRGWSWVDPRSEVAAARDAVALGIKSRTQIVAEQGGDFSDTIAELLAEQEAMRDLRPLPQPGAAAAPAPADASASTSSNAGG